MSATELVERTAAALPEVLDGRELTKDELGFELARRLSKYVTPQTLAVWNTPDGLTRYGETLARFAISVVALHGLFCIAPRRRNVTTFLRIDQWLGGPLPQIDPPQARAGLVRRYLSVRPVHLQPLYRYGHCRAGPALATVRASQARCNPSGSAER
jgi:hypothetical protein